MDTMVFDYPAGPPAAGRAVIGVVGSGDLEVLLEPHTAGRTRVHIHTSVEGRGQLWQAVLNRLFADASLPAANIEVNDCGATPGVVRLRIEQAFEEAANHHGRI